MAGKTKAVVGAHGGKSAGVRDDEREIAQEGGSAGVRDGSRAGVRKVTAENVALYTIIVLVVALGALSQTAANPMLPMLAAEFSVDLGLAQWVTTGYMLVIGIIVPVATYLSRKVCLRTHFIIGMALFVAGAAADAFALDFAMLIGGRILQASAVGILMPLMQVIAVTRFPSNRVGTAMGVGGIALGFAPNFGPTFGAAMESAFGWRGFFVFLTALNALLLVVTLFLVKKDRAQVPAARFEFVSFLFSTLGFGALLIGVSNVSSAADYVLQVALPIVVGIVFIVLFLRRQALVDNPIMDLRMFESAQFNRGLLVMVLHFSAFMGLTMIIPLWVQNLCGGTSMDSGMVLLPAMIVALLMNPIAGILLDRFGIRPVVLGLSGFLIVGAFLEVTVTESTPFWQLALYQAIRQFGIAGLIGPLQTWTLKGLEGPLISDGSSTCILFRQVGASAGAAVMVLLVSVVAAAGLGAAFSYQAAFAFSAALVVVEVVLALRFIR